MLQRCIHTHTLLQLSVYERTTNDMYDRKSWDERPCICVTRRKKLSVYDD
jgi:hypothetical protein